MDVIKAVSHLVQHHVPYLGDKDVLLLRGTSIT
jgi:hypothetical protein